MNLDTLSLEAANFALTHNLKKQAYFSICTLDKALNTAGIQIQCGRSYDILNTLHCINYADMPNNMRDAIPQLIANVIGVQSEPEPETEPVTQYKPRPSVKQAALSFFK